MELLSLSVAKGSMHAIVNGSTGDLMESLGILPQEMQLVTGDVPWVANQRVTVTRTIDSLIFGSMDIMGLPRFEVAAEYLAASLVMFVSPVNLFVACRWMEGGSSSQDLADNDFGSSVFTRVSAQQLLALVLMLQPDSAVAAFRDKFHDKVSRCLERVLLKAKPAAVSSSKGG